MMELGGSWERRSCAVEGGLVEVLVTGFMQSTSRALSRSRIAPNMRPGGRVVGMSVRNCVMRWCATGWGFVLITKYLLRSGLLRLPRPSPVILPVRPSIHSYCSIHTRQWFCLGLQAALQYESRHSSSCSKTSIHLLLYRSGLEQALIGGCLT
jgi:hypothetical protein